MVSPERIYGHFQDTGPAPNLLVTWESPRRAFFSNLGEFLSPSRQPKSLIGSGPGVFWPDVFVHRPIAIRFILDSYALHVLAVLIVYFVFSSPLFWNQRLQTHDPYEHTTLEYYSVSEYLPPVRTAHIAPRRTMKGQPTFAKQQIISVPPEPDNSRQTIVTPDLKVITREVPLPNVMSWHGSPEPIQPLAASADLNPNPKLLTPPDIISPPPEEVPRSTRNLLVQADVIKPPVENLPTSRRYLALEAEPIRPAPDIQGQKSRTADMIEPSVIEPPPTLEALRRVPGSMNVSKLAPAVLEPKLPVSEQRAAVKPPGASSPTAGADTSAAKAAPAAPSAEALNSRRGTGQLIALSAQPAPVLGPIEIPRGTRRGVFAADPAGSLGAPGTPNLVAEKDAAENSGSGATGPGASARGPEGIYVAPGPKPAASGTVVSTTPPPPSPKPELSLRDRLLAAMRGATLDVSKTPPPSTPPKPASEPKIEDKVFGDKKYYSMILNMPNLNSSAGSWIIRFAELNPTAKQVTLSAPVALNKVDPAYPAELMRDKVEGTVVLYAVIRANGLVDSVRVLQSVDDRLDKSAMSALQHWKFRPGTKMGLPVDIEAVVQIPFRLAVSKY